MAAALLLLAGGPVPVGAAESCAACASGAGPVEACTACPPEIRSLLDGKRLLTRRSSDLDNDCLTLEPIHPMLLPENQRLLSKPLDAAEVANARTYGYRSVRALPGCTSLSSALPDHVVLGRPLTPAERLRDDGTPKPRAYVDGESLNCVGPDAPRLRDRIARPETPACHVRTALRATDREGGVIVEIAGGHYQEPRRMSLGHGQVLIARQDEPVIISGWIDISRGVGPDRGWAKVSEDQTGAIWALDWSDHGEPSSPSGLRLPLQVDGVDVSMAPHLDARTVAPDVQEPVLTTHDVEAPDTSPLFLYANPGHKAACMHSGVNVKSRELLCTHGDRTLPCAECRERGLPVAQNVLRNGSCRPPAGACAPDATWRTGKLAGLDLCQNTLGSHVERCLLLKLPRGVRPSDHEIRSSHTDHGFNLFNDRDTFRSGVALRGLRLENVPITAWGAYRITAKNEKTLRLDALKLDHSTIRLLGPGHLVLENSYGEEGKILVSGAGRPLENILIRNNFLNRYYGKPVSWAGDVGRKGVASPRTLHGLAPLCEGLGCAGPEAPVLFSGEEDFARWPGWNKFLFNVVGQGAAINAFGRVSHTAIVGNAFQHGGVQEGIVELYGGGLHVLVHHNWSTDGLGTGIRVHGAVEDLVVTDNQLHRSPGNIEAGAGTDLSAEICRTNPSRPCKGSFWSILLRPRDHRCADVTVENNLSSTSDSGGISLQGCNRLVVRNNTVADAVRNELLLLDPVRPTGPAHLLFNVTSDQRHPQDPTLGRLGDRPHGFPLEEVRGNFFQGCHHGGKGCPDLGHGIPIATDPDWDGPPRYADPEADDFHLVGGWDGPDLCGASPPHRYPHPGFTYADELCSRREVQE